MVEDLVDSGLLIGKSEKEVLAMLGPPDKELGREWGYTVDIGQDFVGSPWLYDLQVSFDEAGHVERTEVTD